MASSHLSPRNHTAPPPLPSKKRKRPNPFDSSSQHNSTKDPRTHPDRAPQSPSNPFTHTGPSLTQLKSTIRALSRTLAHDTTSRSTGAKTLPAIVRAAKERELSSLKIDLAEAEAKRAHRETLAKYHKVRFFEKQKAGRHYKKEVKTLARLKEGTQATHSNSEEQHTKITQEDQQAAALHHQEAQVHAARIDELYAAYAPLGEKYVSLWGGKPKQEKQRASGTSDVDREAKESNAPETENATDESYHNTKERAVAAIRRTKPPLWTLVEKAAAQDRLADVRDGRHEELAALGMGWAVMVRSFLEKGGPYTTAKGDHNNGRPRPNSDKHKQTQSENAERINQQAKNGERINQEKNAPINHGKDLKKVAGKHDRPNRGRGKDATAEKNGVDEVATEADSDGDSLGGIFERV